MKNYRYLFALCLAGLALALVIQWSSPGPDLAHPTTTVASPAASIRVPAAIEKQLPPIPAQASSADDQAVKSLVDLNRDLAARYMKAQLELQLTRDQWRKRWNEDMEKFKTEQAAINLTLQEQEKVNAALDAQIKQILADAKAEVEREKREQAAAAATAPPPTPPQPGASNF